MPKQPTFEEIETHLLSAVYVAALWIEKAEHAGMIHGNGHHAAQEVAEFAVKILRERRVEKPRVTVERLHNWDPEAGDPPEDRCL